MLDVMEWLMRRVRARMATGPRCFKWRADRPSGPLAGEFLACFMAMDTSVLVKGVNGDGGSARVALTICRATLFGMDGFMEVSS